MARKAALPAKSAGPDSKIRQARLHNIVVFHSGNGKRVAFYLKSIAASELLDQTLLDQDADMIFSSSTIRNSISIAFTANHERTVRLFELSPSLPRDNPGNALTMAKFHAFPTRRIEHRRQRPSLKIVTKRKPRPPFGPFALVSSGQGFHLWRDAFRFMLAKVLKDGEDRCLNLPYAQIRHQVLRTEGALDSVKVARLVILGLGEADDVLMNENTQHITAIIDSKRVIWGDDALASSGAVKDVKGLLYACYHAIVTIVNSYLDPVQDGVELNARKTLTTSLTQLAGVDSLS